QQFQVGKGTQTITFTTQPPSAPAFGSTYPVSATGGASGNKVTFSIDAATSHSACTLAGSTVTFNHAGTCIVDADQAAAADYESAPRVQQVVVVPKVAQTITFTSTPPASPRVGDKYPVTATGGASGKPVTFTSTTPKVCTVSGSTVSFVALGGCSIAADQAGNDDYLAAPTATQQVTIGGRDLTLSVTTRHGWLFSLFGTVVDVQVTGLDPGAHATLSMTADHALAWSPSECVGSRTQVTCSVDSTPTTLSFLALAFSDDASLNFTVSSSDSQDSDPGDNTASVPIGN
ncbi:MAG TPA: hypothetical protein VH085_08465, partial [Nocardioides sp.]|nr:hypothetical protein [Nocardioides sp.]